MKALEKVGSSIFDSPHGLLSKDSSSRNKIIQYIQKTDSMSPEMRRYMRDLMCEARHYSFEVVGVLKLPQEIREHKELLEKIILIALRSYDYTNLKDRIAVVMRNLSKDLPAKEKLILQMCDKLRKCETSDLYNADNPHAFMPFRIETIYECADAALTALSVLNHQEYIAEKLKLEALMESFISRNPPTSWRSLFKSAFSTAVFLKYATREDLDTAYAKIKEVNAESGKAFDENSALGKLLAGAANVYDVPAISKKDVEEIMQDVTPSANAYNKVLAKLETAAAAQSSVSPYGAWIYDVTIAWIKHYNRNLEVKIPVPPRNVQILNVLCIWQVNITNPDI